LTATIQHLKRVTLALIADGVGSKPVIFEFIYGIASGGLCSFEGVLHNKGEGENLTITVSATEAHEFFGHLLLPLRQALGLQIMPETIILTAAVIAVADADDREVVQSLAKALAAGGCGGSCGCGC
jgi:hypothetical protein